MKRRKRAMLVVAGIAEGIGMMRRAAATGDDDLHGFSRETFIDHRGLERTYYRTHDVGRPVMVLHEIFGLSPADLRFSRRLAGAGFTVYAPVLFGEPGKAATLPYEVRCGWEVCVRREFALLSWYRSSPVTDALRALGRTIYERHGEPGFGVIGLCLTGNFALAMMADEHLVAPVLGEPSLPFALSAEGCGALGLSDGEIACVKRRIANGSTVLGYRFKEDRICPEERFESLHRTFGAGFEGHSIDRTPLGHHSVFAEHYDEHTASTRNALLRLLEFLEQRLGPRRSAPSSPA